MTTRPPTLEELAAVVERVTAVQESAVEHPQQWYDVQTLLAVANGQLDEAAQKG